MDSAGVRELFESMEYGPAPESADPVKKWLDAHHRKFGIYVGGEWREPSTSQWFDSINPSNGQTIAQISQAGSKDIDDAVASAASAQKEWAALSGFERGKVLYAIARQIQKHSRLFSVLETMDNGKPIRETRDIDIPLVARHFYHHAGWAQLMDSEMADWKPVGVVGQIIPWNFPLLMLSWKIAPALAMGNAVILKPAEFTSLTALLFAEICEAAGVPKGVVNIVTGDGETGKLIVNHPGIQKIAFTGSTEVGRIIRKATAGTDKKISLELGGKSPFIVFEDADLDSAIEGIVDAIWFNQGQVCCAGSRLLVQESIADKFLAKLKRRMETLRVGDPLDKAVDIGAIVDQVQLERISSLVSQGVEEGASLFQPAFTCPAGGWFYPPTLLSNVSPSSSVAQVEIFGPVLVSMTFRTPAEAVVLANNTVYGLAASVWSENINLAHDIAHKVKAGTVWVNCTNMFDASSGFGGYRESGFGREGGREGLFEYVKPKGAESDADRARTETGSVGSQPATRSADTQSANNAETRSAGAQAAPRSADTQSAPVDRTYKQYIGGKQARPDSGYSYVVNDANGNRLGEAATGNRKDIRNAVEAATAAQPAWASMNGHARAQVLYFLAENLSARSEEFETLVSASGFDSREVQSAIEAVFAAAAWADKFEGVVHETTIKGVCYTRNEPLGVLGIVAEPESCFLGSVAALASGIAMGNAVVLVPSETAPVPVLEFVQVLETSDVPGGIVNIISGPTAELAKTLAEHEAVDGLWSFGTADLKAMIESASISNLKQTWCPGTGNWGSAAFRKECLRRATQVKNIWVPIGE